MNKISRRLCVYIALALILTGVAVGLRTAACLYHLDYTYGHFEGKGQITAASSVFFGGVIIMLTFAIHRGRVSLRASFSTPATYVPTGMVGAASLFLALRMLDRAHQMRVTGAPVSPLFVLTAAGGVLLLLSVLHFFYNGYITDARTETRGYFALATIAALACYAAMLYFTEGKPINDPNRLTDQLAFLFSALFFLYEARISLGRERWGGYVVFGLIALMATAYSSIPSLIVYFAKDISLSGSLEENLYTLALFIFITARLMLTVTLPEVEKNATVAATEEIAYKRELAVRETERLYSEKYAVQMSIDDLIPAEDMPIAKSDDEEFELPNANEFVTVFVTEEPSEDGTQLEMLPEVFDVNGTNERSEEDEPIADEDAATENKDEDDDEEDTGN